MSSVVVDSREPGSVKSLCGFEQEELPHGDFYFEEHDVIIERKEASDFASSITDGRLSRQADRMIAEHEHVYVIIEGNPFDLKYSDISVNSLIGMQISLAVKRGIHLVFTKGVEDTLYAVKRIVQRFEAGEHESENTGYVKRHDTGEVDDVQVAMLMQIDGISREKAEMILDNIGFGELVSLASNTGYEDVDIAKDAVKEVDGVGDVLAERVINAFQ